MNFWNIVGTLRKFGNFLIGLFPILGVILDDLIAYLKKVSERPDVAPHWQRFSNTPFWKGITKFFERFYWRDYSKDRLDFGQLPDDTIPILRPVFLSALLMCLSMPLETVTRWSSVSIETFSGLKGEAPIWSVLMWLVAAALAWGSVLAGASISNRVACAAIIVGYVVIFGNSSFFGPPSTWNALLPVAALVTYFFCQKALSKSIPTFTTEAAPTTEATPATEAARTSETTSTAECKPTTETTSATESTESPLPDLARGAILAIVIGIPIGIYLAALTPLHEIVRPNVIGMGITCGIALSLITMLLEKIVSKRKVKSKLPNVSILVWILVSITGVFLLILALRGGLAKSSSYLLSSLMLWNSTLWPIWYFIGIGIIFKLIKNGQVFARSVRDVVPPPVFVPFVVILVVTSNLLTWSDEAVTVLPFVKNTPFTVHLFQLFSFIYAQSASWLWRDVMLASAAEWMKWILLFDLMALVWLAFRRQLTNENVASVFYLTVLAWFLIYEYMFQWLSLGRSPGHSILLVTLFSIWLLWLYQRIGLPMSLQSSPLWPTRGRLPIYGGVMLFCLLEIHARSVMHDYSVMNQLFLVMFRGIIDVGFPYFLYVFATRKFKRLPVKLITIFNTFCLGAVFALVVNLLDKLALNSWSLTKFVGYWNQEVASLTTKSTPELGLPALPASWLLIKSLIVVSALTIVALFIFKRLINTKRTDGHRANLPAALVFTLLSFSSGFASFSKTAIDLPLPANWNYLFAPIHSCLQIDAHVIAIYLSTWLPALVIALFLTWSRASAPLPIPSLSRWILAFEVALTINFVISYSWAVEEPWFRSTDMLYTCGLGLIGLFMLLVCWSVDIINAQIGNEQSSTSNDLVTKPGGDSIPQKPPPIVSASERNAIAALCLALLISRATGQVDSGVFVQHQIPSLNQVVYIPKKWGAVQQIAGKSLSFAINDQNGMSSLILNTIGTETGGVARTMQKLIDEAKHSPVIANLSIINSERWDHFYPGALALYYTFDLKVKDTTIPKLGLTVLCPDERQGQTTVLSIMTTPKAITEQKWDLVRIIERSLPNH